MLLTVGDTLRSIEVHIRVVEESEQELGLEHASHRHIHRRFGNDPILDLFEQGRVAGVQFKVDGNNIGSEISTSPYTLTWDSTAVTPGVNHVLTAVARDTQGRTGTSAPVTVLVEAASTIGQWEAPISMPIVAVHSILLPNGNVIMFDAQDSGMMSRLWNIAANAWTIVNAPINIFCAGLNSLADGRVFGAGGHVTAHVGLNNTELFNEQGLQWSAGPTMFSSRWYPTTTTLPDGRVLIMSGETGCDEEQRRCRCEAVQELDRDSGEGHARIRRAGHGAGARVR